jgi:four helix bundle protein
MQDFTHRKLDAYRVAIEFVAVAYDLCERLPPGHALLADQLRRASTSICLNMAEGAGEFSRKEKGRFYRIAKRSAIECVAILDVFRAIKIALETESGEQLLLRIVSMLTRMAMGTEGDPAS